MFAMGHGCGSDPLYPWIAQTLRDETLKDPDAKAIRLEKKALTWLEHVLANFDKGGTGMSVRCNPRHPRFGAGAQHRAIASSNRVRCNSRRPGPSRERRSNPKKPYPQFRAASGWPRGPNA